MTTVTVEVDVDLGDLETDDLLEELESRGKSVDSPATDSDRQLVEIYHAFKFGLSDRATELARAYVCDQLGVIL